MSLRFLLLLGLAALEALRAAASTAAASKVGTSVSAETLPLETGGGKEDTEIEI